MVFYIKYCKLVTFKYNKEPDIYGGVLHEVL